MRPTNWPPVAPRGLHGVGQQWAAAVDDRHGLRVHGLQPVHCLKLLAHQRGALGLALERPAEAGAVRRELLGLGEARPAPAAKSSSDGRPPPRARSGGNPPAPGGPCRSVPRGWRPRQARCAARR